MDVDKFNAIRVVSEFEPLNACLMIRDKVEATGVSYSELPQVAKWAIAVVSFDLEVHNGGVQQYLDNSSGDTAEDLKRFLLKADGGALINILEKISSMFPKNIVPSDREQRMQDVDLYISKFGKGLFKEQSLAYHKSGLSVLDLFSGYLRGHLEEAYQLDQLCN